ncbi:MAG: HD domain-containing protein [Nitrosarchaeum sp.]|nr:HD domain-containing protein [Nitrosarchaeum sp.]
MKTSTLVKKKIETYNPKGGLAYTAKFFLTLAEVNHESTKDHVERVALLAESVAKQMKKDTKATFFAGLLHDVGKIILPPELFDGHNISTEEYSRVKTHAIAGFKALKKLHQFTALCAGFHHNLYQAGYGIGAHEFPSNWSTLTIKKVLDISVIISICDFVDAFTHRKTQIKDGSDSQSSSLKDMLYQKYPNDHFVIDIVLEKI